MNAVEINRLEYLELSRKGIKYNRKRALYIEKWAKPTKNGKTVSPKCSRFFAAVLVSARRLGKLQKCQAVISASTTCNWNLQVKRIRWPRQKRPTAAERTARLQYCSLSLGE